MTFFRTPVRRASVIATIAAALACALPAAASAADEPQLQRLATCQDSWLDWKDSEARMMQFASFLESRFTHQDDDGAAFTPKSPIAALGVPVVQVFPQSVGMGLGFSMIVDADFARARSNFEKALGRPMTCSTGGDGPACELKIGTKKTAVLMADGRTTLAGCYYYYQQ